MISDRMITDIINAELVVADLSDLNPNAFYELGIRHSTGKPTIHIARGGTILPFDNVAHRTTFVDLTDWQSIEHARDQLAKSARAIRSPGYKVSNAITQANASFKMRESDDPRDRVIADIQERMAAVENAISKTIVVEEGFTDVGRKIAAALERGEKIVAVKIYREATGANLGTSLKFVEAVGRGEKIDAIKVHRSVTGATLKDANEFIQEIRID